MKSNGGCKVLRSSMTDAEKMTEEQVAIVKRKKKMKFSDMGAIIIDDYEILRFEFLGNLRKEMKFLGMFF